MIHSPNLARHARTNLRTYNNNQQKLLEIVDAQNATPSPEVRAEIVADIRGRLSAIHREVVRHRGGRSAAERRAKRGRVRGIVADGAAPGEAGSGADADGVDGMDTWDEAFSQLMLAQQNDIAGLLTDLEARVAEVPNIQLMQSDCSVLVCCGSVVAMGCCCCCCWWLLPVAGVGFFLMPLRPLRGYAGCIPAPFVAFPCLPALDNTPVVACCYARATCQAADFADTAHAYDPKRTIAHLRAAEAEADTATRQEREAVIQDLQATLENVVTMFRDDYERQVRRILRFIQSRERT